MIYEVLDVDLALKHEDLRVFIPVVIGTISFIIFWFTWQSPSLKKASIQRYGESEGLANIIIFTKVLGGLLMGLLPMLAYLIAFPATTLSDLGLGLSIDTLFATVIWTIGLGAVMVFLVWNHARRPSAFASYPQIRAKQWTHRMMARHLFGWSVFLLGYEIFFRGVLLFPLVESIGLWPAIAVNIAIYSGTHIPKGIKEALGTIPMSIVFCLICVQTGNIWVPVIVHIMMAYTNALTSFKHNPLTNYAKT